MTQNIRVYHRTPAADAIARDGFRDGVGTYLTTTSWTGVWVSDVPFDENEGATGPHVFEICLPEAAIAEYEWVEEMKGAREWLVPAVLLNDYPRRLLDDEAVDAAVTAWLIGPARERDVGGG